MTGLRGKTIKGGTWDYTAAYGNNSEDYYGENTNNASQYSLGKYAPTSFYTGTLIYQQFTQSISVDKEFSNKPKNIKSVNLGFGAEWRLENFQMKPGEEAAWQNYDPTGRKDGRSQSGLVVAPEDAINKSREVLGSYMDLETEINDRFLVALAGRYEYYNGFGGNIAGKLAARYKWRDILTLRASINNGYRAPSMQQRYYGNISKGVDAQGNIVRRGIFNNDHEVVKLFGIPPLEPERSINFGAGITSSVFHHIYLTADAYWIQIKDRIVLSGTFDRQLNSEVDSLLVNYPDIDQVTFFTNAINTRTRGFDVVINGNWNVPRGHLYITLATNLNHTQLFGGIKTASNLRKDDQQTNTLFNRQEITRVEEGQPDSKVILLLDYNRGKFDVQLRNTRFGNTKFVFVPDSANYDQSFSAKILTDLIISFHPQKEITVSIGANNLFDVYPDRIRNPENTADGRNIYAMESQPFGFNGGYFFVRLNTTF